MKEVAKFRVSKFLDEFAHAHSVRFGSFDDLGGVGLRLINGDLFYFKLEPCAQKIIIFFWLVKSCVLTEHELTDINESLEFVQVNSNGRVAFFEEFGLVYFNVLDLEVAGDEFFGVSADSMLNGYKALMKQLERIG